MDVEKSYFAVSWFFNAWVRLIEYPTRKREVIESIQSDPRRLIISPPTDAGIPLLVDANSSGQTTLLCFSDRLQRIALNYIRKSRISNLVTVVEPFFRIPVSDESVSVVYANCLFDFCAVEDFDIMLQEIRRALKPGGLLFSVHMTPTTRYDGRLWTWAFELLPFISNGCSPVTISKQLTRNGFIIQKEISTHRLGFPAIYSVSEKPIQAN